MLEAANDGVACRILRGLLKAVFGSVKDSETSHPELTQAPGKTALQHYILAFLSHVLEAAPPSLPVSASILV